MKLYLTTIALALLFSAAIVLWLDNTRLQNESSEKDELIQILMKQNVTGWKK